MSRNPYAPPQAQTTEVIPPTEGRGPQPQQVIWAVRLLWMTPALGVAALPFTWPSVRAQTTILSLASVVFIFAFTLALYGALAFAIGRAKNWARLAFMLLFIVGTLGFPSLFETAFKGGILRGLLVIVQTITQFAAIVLLFTAPARGWFRKPKATA